MPQVQTSLESGETPAIFIQFVMMHAQQAAFALGLTPHPEGGEVEPNFEIAKIFIDQLVMIRTKTRGNLVEDELKVLNNAISNLQMAFVELTQGGGVMPEEAPEFVADAAAAPAPEAAAPAPAPAPASDPAAEEELSRKRFSKSYGS